MPPTNFELEIFFSDSLHLEPRPLPRSHLPSSSFFIQIIRFFTKLSQSSYPRFLPSNPPIPTLHFLLSQAEDSCFDLQSLFQSIKDSSYPIPLSLSSVTFLKFPRQMSFSDLTNILFLSVKNPLCPVWLLEL